MEPLPMAAWKKLLVVLSVLFMAGGVTGKVAAHGRKKAASQVTAVSPAPVTSAGARIHVAGSQDGTKPAEPAAVATPVAEGIDWDQWSPVVFRFGFSFFAGFCIAYALRTVLKIGMLVAGVVLIAVLALQYAGLMNVDWNSVSGQYDSVASWLRGQFGSFKDFLTGHLPSAGAAMAGLVAGFLR